MKLTFCSSLEENLAAAAGECTIMAARGLVGADQAGPLGGEEELHGEGVLSAGLKPVRQALETGTRDSLVWVETNGGSPIDD